MSVRIAYLLPSITRPIATPATGAFNGTPASIIAKAPPQTPAIRPTAAIEDVVAEDLLFQVIEDRLGHRALLWLIFRIALDDFFLQRVDGGVARALFLARRIERCAQTFRVVPLNLSHHLFVKSWWRDRAFLDVESLVEFLLPTTQPINF